MNADSFRYDNDNDDRHALLDNGDAADGVALKTLSCLYYEKARSVHSIVHEDAACFLEKQVRIYKQKNLLVSAE